MLIDYAKPILNIERYIKDISYLCLDGKFDEALPKVVELQTEVRLLQNHLKLMLEHGGIPYETGEGTDK